MSLWRKPALVACWSGGGARVERMRVRAGGARQLSAGLHSDDRHSDVREPHVVLPDGAARDRQGAHRVHRARQLQDRARGDGRRCRAGRRRHERHDCADELFRRAAGVALHDYRDGQHPAPGRRRRTRSSGATRRISIREEYDATSAITNDPTGFVDPSAFFTQESNALERISSEFSRSVVSAILEAF